MSVMLYKILYRDGNGRWTFEGSVYRCGNDLREAYLHAVETARFLGNGKWHVDFV